MVIKERKLVVIINGIGGVGKDTLIGLTNYVYNVCNVSSIDPIKKAAEFLGYQGDKSLKSRKILSAMKDIIVEYNDYPTKYLIKKYEEFLFSTHDIMFVHIREPEEIEKFKKFVVTDCITILVQGSGDATEYGNPADDNVDLTKSDYTFFYDKNDPNSEVKFISIVGSAFERLKPIDPFTVVIPKYEEVIGVNS